MTYKYLVLGAALAAQAGAQEIRCINTTLDLIGSPPETILTFQPEPVYFPMHEWNKFGLVNVSNVVNGDVLIDQANIRLRGVIFMSGQLGPYRARALGAPQLIRRVIFRKKIQLDSGFVTCPDEIFNVADGVVVPNSVPVPTLSWGGIALMLLAFGATAWAARRG
jgi:hypothetical protein